MAKTNHRPSGLQTGAGGQRGTAVLDDPRPGRALHARALIKATLHRSTLHIVTAADHRASLAALTAGVVFGYPKLWVIGVLAGERAALREPVLERGCELAYWVEADDPAPVQKLRMLPTHLPGMMTRRQILEHYVEAGGAAPDDFRFYAAFGLFRLAVIVQQIYFRYVGGQTRDPRFADFGGLCAYRGVH